MKIQLVFIILPVIGSCNLTQLMDDDQRKHFGLSYNTCADYLKSFKCMTACKSIGFQIFRLNNMCKCTCHDLKTSTILPFFKWRTNGTTRVVPKTQSPRLYDIVGTLSPAPEDTTTAETVTLPTDVTNTTGTDTTNGDDGDGGGDGSGGTTVGGGDGSDGTSVGGGDDGVTDSAITDLADTTPIAEAEVVEE